MLNFPFALLLPFTDFYDVLLQLVFRKFCCFDRFVLYNFSREISSHDEQTFDRGIPWSGKVVSKTKHLPSPEEKKKSTKTIPFPWGSRGFPGVVAGVDPRGSK